MGHRVSMILGPGSIPDLRRLAGRQVTTSVVFAFPQRTLRLNEFLTQRPSGSRRARHEAILLWIANLFHAVKFQKSFVADLGKVRIGAVEVGAQDGGGGWVANSTEGEGGFAAGIIGFS